MATKLRKLKITHVAVCPQGANPDADILLFKSLDPVLKEDDEKCTCTDDKKDTDCPVHGTEAMDKAARSTASTNNLPDSAFAYISPGGSKDSEGKTTPRSLRHLPYKTASGAIDKPHLRNALARLEQTDISDSAKASARRKLQAAARSVGIEVSKNAPCDDEDCDDEDCPVHGVAKENGVTIGDVYTGAAAMTSSCTDPNCNDPNCPVHGAMVRAKRQKKRVSKGPVSEMGMHAEPDGDETAPLDYRSRGQQYDLWECLWDKWECFCTTFYDCVGDGDEDNIPHLSILVSSIDQFGEDVAQLLEDCGITKAVRPCLDTLTEICSAPLAKAGAAMAGHRRKRLQDAIAALQQILEECTPEDLPHGVNPPIERAGFSAAQAAGIAGYMKGERMDKVTAIDGATAQVEIETLRKAVHEWEARAKDLEPLVAQVASLEATIAKMKQTPEEQEAEYWAGVPEAVRKKHEADEAEKVELRKQLADARDEREQTVYITKTADFRGFGMVQKHWRILKAIDAISDQEDREELLRLMKSASERDGMSEMYRAAGSEGRYGTNGTVESATASDQMMALTNAYMEEKGVNFLQASAAIAKSHPDLYRRSRDERDRATRVSSD